MYELENDDEIEIDLRELFLALKKKIVWILLTAIVFAGASGLITKFAMTPIYSSTAQLYVVSKGGLSQLTDLTMGTQLTQDYMVIVKTRPVLEQVITDLKLDMDYKELEKKITVENPSDTRIMQITITDKDAALAQSITQDLAEVTAKTVAEKMDVKSPTIIEKAYKPDLNCRHIASLQRCRVNGDKACHFVWVKLRISLSHISTHRLPDNNRLCKSFLV